MASALFDGAAPRLARVAAAVAGAIAIWLAFGGANALAAAEPHPSLFSFDRSGTPGTQALSNPNGIAIDESSGDVYVAALGSDELTGSHTPSGSFSFVASTKGTPAAIAVDDSTSPSDPSRGDLYVMDA